MRIITIDIETSPNLGYVWSLWKANISLSQLKQSGSVMSFAAKWSDSKQVLFYSDFHDGHDVMVAKAYELLSEADVVVHYNGTSFDIPHLMREFIIAGMEPPAPFQQVDLLRHVRKHFRFPSNKLDYVCQALDLGAKEGHTGFQLWVDCLANDEKAWNLMRRYNRQDVVITEKLYNRLSPWINGPSKGLYSSKEECCPKCGSENQMKRGYKYTAMSVYQQYKCNNCGGWSRGSERVGRVRRQGA